MKQTALVLVAALSCLTVQDIRNAECATACRREGYDSGYFESNGSYCYYMDAFSYESVTKKLLKLPGNGHKAASKPSDSYYEQRRPTDYFKE